jgi:hypothetical protein
LLTTASSSISVERLPASEMPVNLCRDILRHVLATGVVYRYFRIRAQARHMPL